MAEGQITDFFSYTFLEITKKITLQNHKITMTCKTHQKSQITGKLLKNHTKNH